MASKIAHFGFDAALNVPVLENSGYVVEECGTSIPKLNGVLQQGELDAIAVSEDGWHCGEQLFSVARSIPSVPLILFQSVGGKCPASQFDLVVEPLTRADDWLRAVAELIEYSRQMRAVSEAVRQHSELLRGHSQSVREESAVLREESAEARQRSRSIMKQVESLLDRFDRNRKKSSE